MILLKVVKFNDVTIKRYVKFYSNFCEFHTNVYDGVKLIGTEIVRETDLLNISGHINMLTAEREVELYEV